MRQLQQRHEIPENGYFQSHGYKVLQIIPDCNNKKEGHRYNSTCGTTMKVIPFKKGWD